MSNKRSPKLSFEFEYPSIERLSKKTVSELIELERTAKPLPYKVPYSERPGRFRQFPNWRTLCQVEVQDPEFGLEDRLSRTYRTPNWHVDAGAASGYNVTMSASRHPTLFAMGELIVCSRYYESIMDQFQKLDQSPRRTDVGINTDDILSLLSLEVGDDWVEEAVLSGQTQISEHAQFIGGSYVQAMPFTMQRGQLCQTLHKSATVPEDHDFVPRVFFRSITRVE